MNRFLWLIRREIWEARVVWIAPVICAAIVIGGAVLAGVMSHHIEFGMDGAELADLNAQLTAAKLDSLASLMLAGVAVPFLIMVAFTQCFYSIDALYGERRDRSVLFWKSLPVSDTETVISKLTVAALVMPFVAAAGMFVGQLGVCAAAAVKLAAVPGLQAHLWNPAVWFNVLSLDVYLAITSALWYAPLVAFYLFVSALAPRAPFAYAVLAPAAVMLAERIVFGTYFVFRVFAQRGGGLFAHIFGDHQSAGFALVVDKKTMDLPNSLLSIMRPLDFLASPDLWLGLAVAAVLVAGAIWARRYRDQTN